MIKKYFKIMWKQASILNVLLSVRWWQTFQENFLIIKEIIFVLQTFGKVNVEWKFTPRMIKLQYLVTMISRYAQYKSCVYIYIVNE